MALDRVEFDQLILTASRHDQQARSSLQYKLRGRKLCGLEAQCFDGVMIEEVIRHRLGVPGHEHPYFDMSIWSVRAKKRYLGQRWVDPIPSMI